jgi:hypothetical protein
MGFVSLPVAVVLAVAASPAYAMQPAKAKLSAGTMGITLRIISPKPNAQSLGRRVSDVPRRPWFGSHFPSAGT